VKIRFNPFSSDDRSKFRSSVVKVGRGLEHINLESRRVSTKRINNECVMPNSLIG